MKEIYQITIRVTGPRFELRVLLDNIHTLIDSSNMFKESDERFQVESDAPRFFGTIS